MCVGGVTPQNTCYNTPRFKVKHFKYYILDEGLGYSWEGQALSHLQ